MKTTLIQRLRNIWRLGEVKQDTFTKDCTVENLLSNEFKPRPPQAQIIKRVIVDPLEEALKDENSTI